MPFRFSPLFGTLWGKVPTFANSVLKVEFVLMVLPVDPAQPDWAVRQAFSGLSVPGYTPYSATYASIIFSD